MQELEFNRSCDARFLRIYHATATNKVANRPVLCRKPTVGRSVVSRHCGWLRHVGKKPASDLIDLICLKSRRAPPPALRGHFGYHQWKYELPAEAQSLCPGAGEASKSDFF